MNIYFEAMVQNNNNKQLRRRRLRRRGTVMTSVITSSVTRAFNLRVNASEPTSVNYEASQLGLAIGDTMRITSVELEVSSPGGTTAQSQIQASIYKDATNENEGNIVRSRAMVVPTNAIRFKLRTPRGTDWNTVELADAKLVSITYVGVITATLLINYALRADVIL